MSGDRLISNAIYACFPFLHEYQREIEGRVQVLVSGIRNLEVILDPNKYIKGRRSIISIFLYFLEHTSCNVNVAPVNKSLAPAVSREEQVWEYHVRNSQEISSFIIGILFARKRTE